MDAFLAALQDKIDAAKQQVRKLSEDLMKDPVEALCRAETSFTAAAVILVFSQISEALVERRKRGHEFEKIRCDVRNHIEAEILSRTRSQPGWSSQARNLVELGITRAWSEAKVYLDLHWPAPRALDSSQPLRALRELWEITDPDMVHPPLAHEIRTLLETEPWPETKNPEVPRG